MKISMSMIASKLKKYNPRTIISEDDIPSIINLKLFNNNQHTFDNTCVYFGKKIQLSKDIQNNTTINLISIGDVNLNLERNHDHFIYNIIALNDELNMSEVFNELQDIISIYHNWGSKLNDALIKGNNLQYIIDISYEIFENPMFLIDSSFRTLAYTKEVAHNELDESWKSIVIEGHTSVEIVNAMKESDVLNWLNSCWEPIINSNPIFTHPRINANIMNGTKKIATLVVIEAFKTLEKAHLHMSKYLCNIILLALQRDTLYQKTRGELVNYFFADLLEGKATDEKHVAYQLKHLDWSITDNYALILIKPKFKDLLNKTYDYISRELENIFIESRSIIINDNIVLIINIRNRNKLSKVLIDQLQNFLESNNLIGGFSSIITNIYNIRDLYLHASATIELVEQLEISGYLFTYENYIHLHLIHIFSEQFDLIKLCHPILEKLLNYDIENNGQLYNTLRVYIENELNLVKSAKELFIHRNTLVYRIKRIIEIEKVNLDDIKVRKHLLLSYDINDYLFLSKPR